MREEEGNRLKAFVVPTRETEIEHLLRDIVDREASSGTGTSRGHSFWSQNTDFRLR